MRENIRVPRARRGGEADSSERHSAPPQRRRTASRSPRSRHFGAIGHGGCCTVYAERPLSLRRYHSLDRAACESEERPFAISRLVVAGITPMELVRGARGEIIDLYEALAQPAWAKLKRTNKSQRQARAAA